MSGEVPPDGQGEQMDDTRDKVIALEVRVEQMGEDIRRLADAVEHLNSLLDQAKGAKLLLGLLMFAGGIVSTYAPTALKWLTVGK